MCGRAFVTVPSLQTFSKTCRERGTIGAWTASASYSSRTTPPTNTTRYALLTPCWPELRHKEPSIRYFTPSAPSLQEIPLSEILEMRPAGNFSLVPSGTNPHCFELITGKMCYFVGEDPNTLPPVSPTIPPALPPTPPSPSQVAPNSGMGREVAKAWESAIRQALMPVIFQDAPPAAGNTTHREWITLQCVCGKYSGSSRSS